MLFSNMPKEKYIKEYNRGTENIPVSDSTVIPCLCGEIYCPGWRVNTENLGSIIEQQLKGLSDEKTRNPQ
jgi:hypothetical protein